MNHTYAEEQARMKADIRRIRDAAESAQAPPPPPEGTPKKPPARATRPTRPGPNWGTPAAAPR